MFARIGAYAELSKLGIVLLVLVSAAAGFMLTGAARPQLPLARRPADARRRHAPILWRLRAEPGAGAHAGRADGANGGPPASLGPPVRAAGTPLRGARHRRGLPDSLDGNGRTAGILGLVAAAFYNGVYTPWLKPTSPFAAVPGAIPGAIPPVIGWVAGGGGLTDAGAIILFGILFLWQMPHFWALSLRYRADYAAGGFPMVSETVGVEGTARLILLYALGLTAWSLAAPTFGVGGPVALVAAAALGARLIWLASKFARRPEDQRGWLSLFLFSNFYLLLLFLAMVGERLLRHALA